MKGFSLIECIALLFCLSIMALLTMSSYSHLFSQYRSQSFIAQLVHDLEFARQQAILRQTVVHLCPIYNEFACQQTQDWSAGYLIYTTAAEHLLVRVPSAGSLTNSRFDLRFGPDGFSQGTNSTFIHTLGEIERRVIINLQGRIRVE